MISRHRIIISSPSTSPSVDSVVAGHLPPLVPLNRSVTSSDEQAQLLAAVSSSLRRQHSEAVLSPSTRAAAAPWEVSRASRRRRRRDEPIAKYGNDCRPRAYVPARSISNRLVGCLVVLGGRRACAVDLEAVGMCGGRPRHSYNLHITG